MRNTPTILLGVGGGVAAYKAADLASALVKQGYPVHVAMTAAATRFIGPMTFAAVTNRQPLTDIFSGETGVDTDSIYPHLYPATQADICILAPATADLIAGVAHGHGHNIVTTSVLSLPSHCRRYYCPSMNVEMWKQGSLQHNINLLTDFGWQRIGPNTGQLACGATGTGRLAEVDEIIAFVNRDIDDGTSLSGRSVLILSGPTAEAIDPVRYISNHSSGRMGLALAETAADMGASVHVISGPVADQYCPCGPHITVTGVKSAEDMLAIAETCFHKHDVVIFAAAVSDYQPAVCNNAKTSKASELTLKLVATPDVAATLCARKKPHQICIGFSLETANGDDAIRTATAKLKKKNLDAIILNGIDSFGAATGTFTAIYNGSENRPVKWGKISKNQCAKHIMREIAERCDRPDSGHENDTGTLPDHIARQ